MTMVKLFNGCDNKTTNNEAFQTDNVYVSTGTHTFANHLECACANNFTIAFEQNKAYGNQVKHHLKYMFINTSAKGKDDIYPITVSEIAAAQ